MTNKTLSRKGTIRTIVVTELFPIHFVPPCFLRHFERLVSDNMNGVQRILYIFAGGSDTNSNEEQIKQVLEWNLKKVEHPTTKS